MDQHHGAAARPTFFRSAARGLHSPAARRAASRKTRRGSAGPANGRASAAAKSWAAATTRKEMKMWYEVQIVHRARRHEPAPVPLVKRTPGHDDRFRTT